MATKTPIICPLSTSFIEMTDNGKRAYVVENLIPTCSIVDNVVREQCDIYEVADTILHVASGMQGLLDSINFTENHNKRVNSAYDYINSLSWKEICKSWIQYFKETY
jgi:glycosyltransferase involved in cell wall biosynthesis